MPSTTPFSPPLSTDEGGRPVLPEPPVSIELSPLMGTAQSAGHKTMLDIYASHIATLVWSSPPSYRFPVVVGLAIRKRSSPSEGNEISVEEEEREHFFEIMEMVKEGLKQMDPRQPTH